MEPFDRLLLKTLQECTEKGLVECKKALEDNEWDLTLALIDTIDYSQISDAIGVIDSMLHECDTKQKAIDYLILLQEDIENPPPKPDDEKLLEATIDGNLQAVKKLLSAGKCRVDAVGNMERTPLHNAARDGNVEIAKLLLDAGADPNKLTPYGENALDMSLTLAYFSKIEPEMVKILVEAGCKVNRCDGTEGWTPLYACATRNGEGMTEKSVQTAEVLISLGAGVDKKTVFGDTPLHRAVIAGHVGMVRLLIKHGADLTAVSRSQNKTPYELAMDLQDEPVKTEILNVLKVG